jgi:hypothetical protein
VLLATLLTAAGCGDGTGPDSIERKDLIRSFKATQYKVFFAANPSQFFDYLANGEAITIVLQEDGTTFGLLEDPALVNGPLDLRGTFDFDEKTSEVTFDLPQAEGNGLDAVFKASRTGGEIQLKGEVSYDGGSQVVTITLVSSGAAP